MFICDSCKTPTKPGDKMRKVIMETRAKVYGERYDDAGRKVDNGGTGWEIVKEIKVGPCCTGKPEIVDRLINRM